jgi:Rps23 Pro-64 3,4-dihydroxylase Tpa1-like proline 4-hydroxylase
MKSINNFLCEIDIEKYKKIYQEDKIVNIPSFIQSPILEDIKSMVEEYEWWDYAILPYNNIYETEYKKTITNEECIACINHNENKQFCYKFKRSSVDKHYDTCYCISCILIDTVKDKEVIDMLCQVVGCKDLIPNEIFLSNYGKDDFLSIHHDKEKGDISVNFSLAYDWHPTYGGILHFCNEDEIYKSIVPNLGSVSIFKLDKENGLDHFVSSVSVNKNRYMLSGWYTIVNP